MNDKKRPGKKRMVKKRVDEKVFHSRKHPRIPFQMEVEYKVGRQFEKGVTNNISRGGIFIKSDEPLPGGKKTTLKFVLDPDMEPVELKGRVVWFLKEESKRRPGHSSGMGVEFVYDDENKRTTMSNFVRDLFDLWRITAIADKHKKDN